MKEHNYIVYMHTSPNGKVYIGQTHYTLEKRSGLNGKGYSKQPKFWNAIKKYGWNNFKHEVLFSNLSKEEASLKEIELIKLYDSTNKKYGYNVSPGGENGHNELWNDDEYRNKQTKERKDRWNNKEYRDKIINSMREAICSDIYKEKQALNTHQRWEDGNYDEIHCKKVICLETGIIYKSITEASELTNIYRCDIGKCCLSKMRTAGGYHWQYYSNDFNIEENRIKLINEIGSGRGKKIICIETNKVYNSIKEATIDVGVDNSSIIKVIKGKRKTAGGFHWMYYEDYLKSQKEIAVKTA